MPEASARTVGDLMVTTVSACRADDSLLVAHQLMTAKQIRHVPVVDEEQHLVGLLNQREMLKELINIVNNRGTGRLEYYESKIPVSDVMRRDVPQIAPDMSLREAAACFMSTHQGCLPVTEDGKLVGILGSGDFVRLSLQLLDEGNLASH